jgi:predicted transcriptional regulator
MQRDAMHSTSIRLDPDTRARLAAVAEREDRSLAYVIKRAIAEYLDRQEREEGSAP